MKHLLNKILIILIFIFFLPIYLYATSCTVTQVIDGDTFYCLPKSSIAGVKTHKDGSISVRLYGIDAPEKDQPYGLEARNSLKDLVEGKTVELDVKNIDRYGRAVAYVYVSGLNVNLEQVKRGFAWAYREYLDTPYASEFYSAEKEARDKELGLWKQANLTPPGKWEKIKKYKEKVFTNEDLEKYYKRPAKEYYERPAKTYSEKYYDRRPAKTYSESEVGSTYQRQDRTYQTSSKYVCGKKYYCSQMESCEEAMFYYTVCGLKRLDGDNDGIPCEILCGHH
jgi:endonuclease YncB( thermonuclease family)